MNSCLYECSVMHHRLAPKEHHFRHDIFMFYLDLDELDAVARAVRCFSRNRANLYAFRDDDHLPTGASGSSTGVSQAGESSESPRGVSPHPGPLPGGEGESHPAFDKTGALVLPKRGLTVSLSPGERAGVRGKELLTAGESSDSLNRPRNLKVQVIHYLAANGISFDPHGRIMLLTLPRVAGYIFNPVSIYYCFNPSGAPLCALAEVGNTFGEMKLFLLRSDELRDGKVFQKLTPKHFYVSPFSSLELGFDFKLRIPGDKLDIRIDDRDGDAKVLLSTLTGTRAALSNARLLWFTIKYPLITLKVIALIHWHAFVLWLKRVPLHRKADNPALQSGVLRPHPTLSPRSK